MWILWEVFAAKNEGREEHVLYGEWASMLDEVAKKSQNDMDAADWGVVMEHVDSMAPYDCDNLPY